MVTNEKSRFWNPVLEMVTRSQREIVLELYDWTPESAPMARGYSMK